MTIIFPIVQIALAVYFLVGAIGGKNKIFDPRFVKDGKEKVYKKAMRIMFGVTGGLMIALGGINLAAGFLPQDEAMVKLFSTLNLVLGIAVLTSIVVMFVARTLFMDKAKREAAFKHTAPRAAFYFDEDEK